MSARVRWEEHALARLAPIGPARARERLLALGEIRDRILAGARLEAGLRVLDLGSGSGLLAFAAADAAGPGRTVAVDLDEDSLRRAGAIGGGAVLPVLADVRRLPVAGASAGAVVWRSVLVYMEGRDDALAEVFRVLRPGGCLSFSESLGHELDLALEAPLLRQIWGALKEIAGAAIGEGAFTADRLSRLVEAAGFESVRVEPEPRCERLPDARAVRAFFADRPPGGLSLLDVWRTCGVDEPVLESFLDGTGAAAPLVVETPEAYVTARKPA